jgi:peptide/nickel transport system ATP-binding protein/oligopeptide transport system ATP-binding protein
MEKPLLQVNNLSVRFPIRKGVFARTVGWVNAASDVSFSLANGETLGIVGESGSGKTTVARSVLMLNKPSCGEILLDGKDIKKINRQERLQYRRDVQAVFQDPLASLNPRFTVLEVLTEAMLVHKLVTKKTRVDEAVKLLEAVGLSSTMLDRYPHAFSGGQRQRLCIARALALKPRLLICDEAVSALDLSVRAQILNLLEDLKEKYSLSYLFITHDIGVVRHIADRVIVMHKGRIVEAGETEAVIGNPQNEYTKYLMAAGPEIGTPLKEEE